jgi:hypothetical protein
MPKIVRFILRLNKFIKKKRNINIKNQRKKSTKKKKKIYKKKRKKSIKKKKKIYKKKENSINK